MEPILALRPMVDQVVESLAPLSSGNGSSILNEIPESLWVSQDPQLLAHLLGGLAEQAICFSQQERIQVGAELFNNIILLNLSLRAFRPSESCIQRMAELDRMAASLGGCISIRRPEPDSVRLVFSFPRQFRLAKEEEPA